MSRTTRPVFPRAQARLAALGERLRLARLRRRISQTEMASRVGVSRMTLVRLERGEPAVALAVLVRALSILGLEADVDRLAADDQIGSRLRDLELPTRPRGRSARRR